MPILDDTQVKAIAKHIAEAKGILRSKKQKTAWDEDQVYGHQRPYYFKGKLPKITKEHELKSRQNVPLQNALPFLDVDMKMQKIVPKFTLLENILPGV